MKLLLTSTLLISSSFLSAMLLPPHCDFYAGFTPHGHRRAAIGPDNKVEVDPEWKGSKIRGVPHQITILDANTPITDELLLNLNPAFEELKKTLTLKEKNKLLKRARWYPGGDHNQHVSRCLIALAVCIGADINLKLIDNAPIEVAMTHTDFQLAKYLIAKQANLEVHHILGKTPLESARSVELAQLLIDNGAQIPATILHDCASDSYPADLTQFYLDRGCQPIVAKNLWIPLHCLAFQMQTPNQIAKTQMLLKPGFHLLQQDKFGRTFLHLMADDKRKKLCSTVINHFFEQHKGFLLFLAHIRTVCPTLYKTKGLLKQYFIESASHMKNLRLLLEMKNEDGKKAFDIWPIETLNPKNYPATRPICEWKKQESRMVKIEDVD